MQSHTRTRTFALTQATLVFAALLALCIVMAASAHAAPKVSPPKKVKVAVVGDRIVDIAFNLGVMPEVMSVRGNLWPMADKLKNITQLLGCPNCVTAKNTKAVPGAMKKRGIKRLILSTGNSPYCLLRPDVRPEKVKEFIKDPEISIEYVDFSQGLESAIHQTAELFGVPKAKADELIQKRNGEMELTKRMLPGKALDKTVVILNGTFMQASGKLLLRAEAPGGYSDKFLLKPLGCENVGDVLNVKGDKPSKGHFMIRKSRHGFDLSPLVKADPDVIVATGDCFAVQKALADYASQHPELMNVKALRDMAVFALPAYVDSGVIEYPAVLRKWAVALGR